MNFVYDIPEGFWSLFRSKNREIYMEALLQINEEYEYNNYFLTRDACLQILSDYFASKKIQLEMEESENELDILETPAARILNWLVRFQWLKKAEDYGTFVTNIVIPDYAAIFIEAFDRLTRDEMDQTDLYIQNVYATLYSFQNNPRLNISMLKSALVNTRKLNKALQDMLHNMDRFFGRLLEQKNYGQLLAEHLEGYVEEAVSRKYHILKTSDNFYLYKMDIKECLEKIRDNEDTVQRIGEDGLEILNRIERSFDDIERRISNMDKEHTKYIRATVTRLNYLLSGQTDTKGLVVQLLNHIGNDEDGEEKLVKASEKMNLSLLGILSDKSLYKRRKGRKDFISQMEREEEKEELSRKEVLKLNRIHTRYSKEQIEEFIESHMEEEKMNLENIEIRDDSDFEKIILAYDYSMRNNSRYQVIEEEGQLVKGKYRFPKLTFVRRRL